MLNAARSAWTRAAAAVLPTAALAFGLASNADAQTLQAGQCLPKAEVLAALEKDKQSVPFNGNRIFSENSNANLLTSNPERTLGYSIEGDAPIGSPSKILCVRATYTNIHVNGVENPTVPVWFPKLANNEMNVEKWYKGGGRILMLADTFTQDANGSRKVGQKISLAALPSGAGTIDAIDARGNLKNIAALKNTQITDFGRALASSDPATQVTAMNTSGLTPSR